MLAIEQITARLRSEEIIILSDDQNNVEMHGHDFIELVYIRKGSVLLTWNNQQTRLRERNFFIVDFGIMHSYRAMDNEPFELINCMFLPMIKRYVAQNFCRSIRLSDIAEECHYTVPYLGKTFPRKIRTIMKTFEGA